MRMWLIKYCSELVIGLVYFVLSLIPAFILYFRAKKEKRPVYLVLNTNRIDLPPGSVPSKLTILYGNQEQHRVTISDVALWNAGREPILRKDIVDANPVGITFSGTDMQVLDTRLLPMSSPCDFKHLALALKNEKDGGLSQFIPITFNHMNHNEGVIFQVVHNQDASVNIRITGGLVGVEKIERVTPDVLGDLDWTDLFVAPLFPLAGIGFGLGLAIHGYLVTPQVWAEVIFGLCLLVASFFLARSVIRMLRSKVSRPEFLKKYLTEKNIPWPQEPRRRVLRAETDSGFVVFSGEHVVPRKAPPGKLWVDPNNPPGT